MALSVKLALSESPRPLAGMLPFGDRTFLPDGESKPAIRAATRLQAHFIVAACSYFVPDRELKGFQSLNGLARATGFG